MKDESIQSTIEDLVHAADPIHVVSRRGHGVTSALVPRVLLREPQLLRAGLQAPELPVDLRAWMEACAERTAERAT